MTISSPHQPSNHCSQYRQMTCDHRCGNLCSARATRFQNPRRRHDLSKRKTTNCHSYTSCLYSDRESLRRHPGDTQSAGDRFYDRFRELLVDEIMRSSIPSAAALLLTGAALVSQVRIQRHLYPQNVANKSSGPHISRLELMWDWVPHDHRYGLPCCT